MKKQLSNLIAAMHFYLGALLFHSGIARSHRRLHEFSMRELQRAADLGWTQAQVLFGQLLRYRGATDFNKIAGIRYLRESAAEGSIEAQFMLAEAILDKDLIESPSSTPMRADEGFNLNDPIMLYLSAAKSGHRMAALRLSKIYRQGSHDQKMDVDQAEYWLDEFMKKGNQK